MPGSFLLRVILASAVLTLVLAGFPAGATAAALPVPCADAVPPIFAPPPDRRALAAPCEGAEAVDVLGFTSVALPRSGAIGGESGIAPVAVLAALAAGSLLLAVAAAGAGWRIVPHRRRGSR